MLLHPQTKLMPAGLAINQDCHRWASPTNSLIQRVRTRNWFIPRLISAFEGRHALNMHVRTAANWTAEGKLTNMRVIVAIPQTFQNR